MSAPTYDATPGRQSTVARGLIPSPISDASTGAGRLTVGMYGVSRMEAGGKPRKRWIMVVLPTTMALLTCEGAIPVRRRMRSRSSCTVSRTRRASSSSPSSFPA